MTDKIEFTLDGKTVVADKGETIWDVAKREGTRIPHLCHVDLPGYRPDGNCRACMVEIGGERVLAASCIRKPAAGMVVKTDTERAKKSREMVFELLASNMRSADAGPDNQSNFWQWASSMGIAGSERFASKFDGHDTAEFDITNPAIAVNLDACIACGACVRACREVQVNDVIGMADRGDHTIPVFDMHDPMGLSTCVTCGECVQACPTGALFEKTLMDKAGKMRTVGDFDKVVDSLCPYCGVGCQTRVAVKDNRIVQIDGRNGFANENRLCVKGRFGFDYAMSPERLTKPLIRRDDAPKSADADLRGVDPMTVFREATWEEALARAAQGLKKILQQHGGRSLAGFGSAKGSNEEAYLFQKLVRQGFGTNNVDHCTRLCHASSVAALMEGVGSGAVSAPFNDALKAECIMVIGARPTTNHPVAATFFKQAAKRGAKLIVIDPRGQDLMRHATHSLRFRAGSDVALLNSFLHTIIDEKLYDEQYIQANVSGFEALKAKVKDFSPEAMAEVVGIDAATLRDVARTYAKAESSIIFWGMGISQHTHGTDNSRCLIALSLITGHVGRPGTGLHPLRGQNNVQGASDVGLIPMYYPDYKSVENVDIRGQYENFWGQTLDPKRGLTVVEIIDDIHAGGIKGMYIIGVVYGDIGTSPLYAMKESFIGPHPLAVDPLHIFGVLSLIFWSLMLIVTVKYVFVAMRADNHGEGGSFALLALISRHLGGKRWTASAGHARACSPTCAVLRRRDDHAGDLGALGGRGADHRRGQPRSRWSCRSRSAILIGLFLIQSRGTARVGALFGPVVLVYFAVAGGARRRQHRRAIPRSSARSARTGRSSSSLYDPQARLPRDGLGVPRGDRRRDALCRHGPFRAQGDRRSLARRWSIRA